MFPEVLRPNTWLISCIDMFIVPFYTIRCQSGPLAQSNLRRFCLRFNCEIVIPFFDIGALCNKNIAKILGAIFIFRFWFSRYIAFNYPGNKYFIVSVKCRREMAVEKGVVVAHDGVYGVGLSNTLPQRTVMLGF